MVLSLSSLVAIAVTLVASYVIAEALVLSGHKYGPMTMDMPDGIRKFHVDPTPRVGGIAIYIAITAAWIVLPGRAEGKLLATVLLAGMPALMIGLMEDVTKRVRVGARLLVTMGSGCIAALWSGAGITRVDMTYVDALLAYWPLAVLFTAFCVGGVANAINIVDGFHGLASGTVMISLLALAGIAISVGDAPLAIVAIVVAAAVAGFWLVNFPWGRLFLGDGGAYFSGFTLAWLSVELLARHPKVSPWASVLLCGYPTVEVIYSILRRRKQHRSATQPDHHHLHSLVAMHVVQPRLRQLHPDLCNSAGSLTMWTCAIMPVLPAIFFPTRPDVLLPWLAGFFLVYHLSYRRVASLESPGDRKATTPEEAAVDAQT